MRIGYLHVGEPGDGLHRYGGLLAGEAARRPELGVVEARAVLDGPEARGRLENAARVLGQADVVHVQYNARIWGGGWAQLSNVGFFLRHCDAPVVATLHDVYWRDPWLDFRRKSARRQLGEWLRVRAPMRLAWSGLARRAAVCIVCNAEEAHVLSRRIRGPEPHVIEHFVEERGELPERDAARAALGLDGRRVLCVLGFIHPAKGHDLLVDALPHLPADTLAVFAGAASPGNEAWLHELEKRAPADRLRVTGSLSEPDLERYLVATDLAVAPFRFASASGSLATWISAGRPTLASDLSLVRAYDKLTPGAIDTFSPFEPEALADAVLHALALASERGAAQAGAVSRLREQLLLPRIFERHLALYRDATRSETMG